MNLQAAVGGEESPLILWRGSQEPENQPRGRLASVTAGPKDDHTIKEELSGKTRTVSLLPSPAFQNPSSTPYRQNPIGNQLAK